MLNRAQGKQRTGNSLCLKLLEFTELPCKSWTEVVKVVQDSYLFPQDVVCQCPLEWVVVSVVYSCIFLLCSHATSCWIHVNAKGIEFVSN